MAAPGSHRAQTSSWPRRGCRMRQGVISLLGTWWRSNRGELEACRRELSEALQREKAASDRETAISRELSEAQEQQAATSPELSEAQEQQAATSRELSDSLEREKATSQVLGIISSSPSDLERVFEAILANATRLCEASHGTLWLCEGEAFRVVAVHGALPAPFV